MYGLERKYKTYFFIVSLNATLGSFCFGYGMSQINSIALIGGDIAPGMFSILSLILSLGAMIGAYLGFPISDSKGRRFGFFIADLIAVLGVALVMFIQTCIGWKIRNETVAILILARFVTGLSIGIFSYLVPLYCILYVVREIVPTEISSSLISLHAIMIALGHFIAYVATLVSIDSSMIYISFCIPALAVGIQAFFLLFFYEFETPSFLWLKNRRTEVISTQAMDIISRLYLSSRPSLCGSISDDVNLSDTLIITLKDVMRDESLRKSLLSCIGLGAFSNLVGINLFLLYFPAYAGDLPGFPLEYQTFTIYFCYFILSLFIFLVIGRKLHLRNRKSSVTKNRCSWYGNLLIHSSPAPCILQRTAKLWDSDSIYFTIPELNWSYIVSTM